MERYFLVRQSDKAQRSCGQKATVITRETDRVARPVPWWSDAVLSGFSWAGEQADEGGPTAGATSVMGSKSLLDFQGQFLRAKDPSAPSRKEHRKIHLKGRRSQGGGKMVWGCRWCCHQFTLSRRGASERLALTAERPGGAVGRWKRQASFPPHASNKRMATGTVLVPEQQTLGQKGTASWFYLLPRRSFLWKKEKDQWCGRHLGM